MILRFTKMNGAGNDFILLDNRDRALKLTTEQIVRLCHRQRGVGADGVLLVEPCGAGTADWAWSFFNSDGSTADMCGNGARCFARYVQRLVGLGDRVTFQTGAGVITAALRGERVTVNLTRPSDLRLNQSIAIPGESLCVHSLNTGVPHAVIFVAGADQAMVQNAGAAVRHHPAFAPRGTNVNFVQVLGPASIRVRTYERGVEGETLACGTGVTASALVAARLHGYASPVQVRVQGGETLEVSFDVDNGEFTNVCLSGPAEFVFDGEIDLK